MSRARIVLWPGSPAVGIGEPIRTPTPEDAEASATLAAAAATSPRLEVQHLGERMTLDEALRDLEQRSILAAEILACATRSEPT